MPTVFSASASWPFNSAAVKGARDIIDWPNPTLSWISLQCSDVELDLCQSNVTQAFTLWMSESHSEEFVMGCLHMEAFSQALMLRVVVPFTTVAYLGFLIILFLGCDVW